MLFRDRHDPEPESTIELLDRQQWTDPTDQKSPRHGKRPSKYVGWRVSVIAGALCSIVVFIINLTITIWATTSRGVAEGGKQILFEGSCKDIRPINLGAHVLINALSTILLSASNFCMQCMSAPTREEIDKAHSQRNWLDIGIPSVRNLSKISSKRVLIWWALALSSVPLHLFFNAAVYASLGVNSYRIFIVNEAFAIPTGPNQQDKFNVDPSLDITSKTPLLQDLRRKAISGQLEKLSVQDCIAAYEVQLQSARGNLILISDSATEKDNVTAMVSAMSYAAQPLKDVSYNTEGCVIEQYDWMCGPQVGKISCGDACSKHLAPFRDGSSTWKPLRGKQTIVSCLSEPVEEHCKLVFSLHIAVLIIVLNLCKTTLMLLVAFGIKESPLMTIGDAISSFLNRNDSASQNMCLASRKDFLTRNKAHSTDPRKMQDKRLSIYHAASPGRWTLSFILCGLAILTCSILLEIGRYNLYGPKTLQYMFSLGIGAVRPATVINWQIPSRGASGLIGNVLVANLPQAILSFIYFTFNGLMTSCALSAEWLSYSKERKGLRLSGEALGSQRGTYFLQLPYRFGLPLLVVSGFLHWLVSQSIFLVSVENYETDNEDPSFKHESYYDIMTCGWSPLATLLSTLCVGGLVIFMCVLWCFKLPARMPLAGSCSLAIAAACHPDQRRLNGNDDETPNESAMAYEKVQWGVVSLPTDEIGHCAFSAGPVSSPIVGTLYAGSR